MDPFVREFLPDIRSFATGKLGVIEFNSLPFVPKRLYWLAEVPDAAERGHHAHKKLSQMIYVIAGSVELVIRKGLEQQTLHLDPASPALILSPGLWREIRNFRLGSIVLVLCDDVYKEDDYIRNYSDYLDWFSGHHD
jgi:hypothetical protein